jgi:cellulase/cellobiase CelA1
VPPVPTTARLVTTVTVSSNWETGYCANVDVQNQGANAVDWKVAFTTPGVIKNLWNANYSQQGNTVTAEGLSWNNSINPNGKISFGFCASK